MISMDRLQTFVTRWAEAGGQVVQHWVVWERLAAEFFCNDPSCVEERSEVMHQVMVLVMVVCSGTISEVKRALREAGPSSLEVAKRLLGHLPHFSAVIDAELRFRLGELSDDWSLEPDGSGRCVVRSEFRKPRVEH